MIAPRTVVGLGLIGLMSQAVRTAPQQAGPGTPPPEAQRPSDSERSLKLGAARDLVDQETGQKRLGIPKIDWSFDPGPWCPGCPGLTGTQPPLNRNAPSLMSGAVSYSASDGSRLTFGLLGYRNSRLPAFLFRPIGGQTTFAPVPASSLADVSNGLTQWQLSIGFQKTVVRQPNGSLIGVVGDVFIPLNSTSVDGVPREPALPSRAVRGGLTFGF